MGEILLSFVHFLKLTNRRKVNGFTSDHAEAFGLNGLTLLEHLESFHGCQRSMILMAMHYMETISSKYFSYDRCFPPLRNTLYHHESK